MKKFLAVMLSLIMLAAAGCFASCAKEQQPNLRADATVTLFSTNDIHGNVEGGDASVGIVRAAART